MKHIRFWLFIIASLTVFSFSSSAQTWGGEVSAVPSPKHEVRAVWLATIGGIDWPRTTGAAAQRRELEACLDRLQQAGINTVLFQARVRATTLYPSSLEPWEGTLTGTPGQAPGYDPLQLCIDLCHQRGMECHAWVVTIPVGKWNTIGCRRLREKYPNLIKRIGEEGYMDPEQELTGDYLARICREITQNYDIDGIHLDYIRYPETWKIKVSRQKGRENITGIVRKIHTAVKAVKPWVKMSCSPVGKHDDLRRYRAGGWNARSAVCQDAQEWLRKGLMDQLYPMMYFKGNDFYPFAVDWQENAHGRMVAGGLGIYFLDPREGHWTLDVVSREMYFLRQLGMGHCFFRAKFLNDNVKGIYDFTRRFNATPALVPPMTWTHELPPKAPANVSLNGHTLSWTGASDRGDGLYLLYNIYASEDYPVDITRAENLMATRLRKTSVKCRNSHYNYAVTAVDRYGQESAPAQLLVNAGPRYTPPTIARSDGRPVQLPKQSLIDADYIIIETLYGKPVAMRRYAPLVSVNGIPDGMYQLRTLGRKGRNHRIGIFTVKRPKMK
jgi:uncharacterized lipoprotein YddW (UPF0748 family)